MNRLFFVISFIAFQVANVTAQSFEMLLDSQSFFYNLVPLHDNNLLCIGSKGVTLDEKKIWVVKSSLTGQVLFEKSISPFGDGGIAMGGLENSDNSIVLSGLHGNTFTTNGFVIKTNAQGNIVWAKDLGTGAAYTVAVLPDGKLLAAGISGGVPTVWKLTSTGNIIWSKTYNNAQFNGWIQKILVNQDGSLYLAGRGSLSIFSNLECVFAIKTDADGNQLWAKYLGTNNYDIGFIDYNIPAPLGAVLMSNGDLVMTENFHNQVLLLRYNPEGQKIWQNTYGGGDERLSPYSLTKDADDNIYVGGKKLGYQYGQANRFSQKISPSGIEIWNKTYAGTGYQSIMCLHVLADGSLVSAGYRKEIFGYNNRFQAFLGKSNEDGSFYARSLFTKVFLDQNNNCIKDSGDVALNGWQINLAHDSVANLLITDSEGQSKLKVADGSYKISLIPPSTFWLPCQSIQNIDIQPNSPDTTESLLLVQKTGDCPDLRVSITVPDLVLCQESLFFINCTNKGTSSNINTKVLIKLDPYLNLLSSQIAYIQNTEGLVFDLGEIPPLGTKRFYIKAKLDCNAPLGLTHCTEAKLLSVPPCSIKPILGVQVETTAKCVDNHSVFTLKNTGMADMAVPESYQILSDGSVIESGTYQLAAGQEQIINFQNEGHSVHFYIKGQNRFTSALEGCGTTDNGFTSTGFSEILPHPHPSPTASYACVENRTASLKSNWTSIPEGYGDYHYVDTASRQEFCLRFQNTLGQTAQKLEIRLKLSENLDASSFEVLATSFDYQLSADGEGTFIIKSDNINLPASSADPDGSKAFFRCSADLKSSFKSAIFKTNGQVYLDDVALGPFPSVYQQIDTFQQVLSQYPSPIAEGSGMKIFGGKDYESANSVVENEDKSFFLIGTTLTFGIDFDLFLVKTDRFGKGIWQKTYDFFKGNDLFISAVSDGEGGIVATGFQNEIDSSGIYTGDTYLTAVRIDKDGNVLWYKHIKPGLGNHGADPEKIIRASDGNFVITGYIKNGGNSADNFLWKLSPTGEELWLRNYVIDGTAFRPVNLFETSDKGYFMIGSSTSTIVNGLYCQKTDSNGETLWTKAFDYNDSPPINDVAPAADGGWMVLGDKFIMVNDSSYRHYPVLTKLDSLANFEWQKVIEEGYYIWAYDILNRPDGSFILSGDGIPDTSADYRKMPILVVDSLANLLSINWHDAAGYISSKQIIPISDNRNAFAAQCSSDNYLGNTQAVLMIVQEDGTLNTAAPYSNPKPDVLIFPNPVRSYFTVMGKGAEEVTWQMYDIQGQMVSSGQGAHFPFTIDAPQNSGLYQISLKWGNKQVTRSITVIGNR